jgi:two-component system, OmpR family, sensor kinase
VSGQDLTEGHLRSDGSTEGHLRSEPEAERDSGEGRPPPGRSTEGHLRSERGRAEARGGLRGWWARRGLRTRITLVVAVVAVVVLAALARLGAGLLLSAVVTAGDGELRERAGAAGVAVARGVPAPPGIRVTDVAGAPTDGRGPLPLDPAELRTLAAGEPVTGGGSAPAHDTTGPLTRWVAVPVTLPDGSRRLVLASRDLLGAVVLLQGAARWFLPGVLVGAAVLTAAAWIASRAALRPVDRLRRAARDLGPGERLPVPSTADEPTALAVEINALLARRDDAVDRLRRFSDDAAHELRSPIASLRAQAEVAVAHPSPGSSDEEREAWRSVARDAERLSDLVSDLLALARAEGGVRGDPEPVDLADALGEALARSPDDDGAVPVTVWVPVPVHAAATPAEVGLVLDNLLDNARRHARSVVHVAAVPAGRWVRLLVDDDGPGIPPADRERVFDRFTRLDATGGTTGAGLGLALVARLVEGRGGTVRAGESPDGGARLAVRWPAPD